MIVYGTVLKNVLIKDCKIESCTVEFCSLSNVTMSNAHATNCVFTGDNSNEWKEKARKMLHDPEFDVNKILVDAIACYLMHNPTPE